MIAGMTKLENIENIIGWPVLSKIPFLGTLFSYRLNEKKRTEIIIFLTPRLARGDADLRGDEITKIVPMEYLPENLQKKVARDKAIDRGLYTPEKMKDEVAKKEAIEMVTEETADRTAKIAAEKDAVKAAKIAAQRTSKTAKTIDSEAEKPVQEGTAKDYYQKGLRAQADSNPKEAIRNFIKATELDNKYAASYNVLGVLYEQDSKLEKAESMYLKAIEVDPHFCAAYSNLALFNEARGDFPKALEYWRKRALYGASNDLWTIQALKRIKELEN